MRTPFSIRKGLETQTPALVLEAVSGLPTPPLHIKEKHEGLNGAEVPVAAVGFRNRAGELSEGPAAARTSADARSF